MPKIMYKPECAKIIKRRKPFAKRVGILFFVAASLGFVIMLANLLAVFLVPGSFSFASLFGKGSVEVKAQTMYFVNMNKYNSYDTAQAQAELFALQGASAYIWQTGDEFLVVGNVYKTKEDAQNVQQNLQTTNPDVFLTTVNFSKVNLRFDDYSKEQKLVVQNALNNIVLVANNLYDYFIKLDKEEITPTTASSLVNEHKSKSIIISSNLDVLNSTVIYESTIKIKNAYVQITEILNELMLKLLNETNIQHSIKYSYVNLLNVEYELFNNF